MNHGEVLLKRGLGIHRYGFSLHPGQGKIGIEEEGLYEIVQFLMLLKEEGMRAKQRENILKSSKGIQKIGIEFAS
jgi:hypothetical protein